jgi:photosystem II stability/assembly factor-like uncharacterized protein
MATNPGDNVSTSYDGMSNAFDKVVFQPGKPVLDSELNLAQELVERLTQKSTAHLPSGWLSYRPYYTAEDLGNSFYTQSPEGAKPEVALVNGWPIYVTSTNTPLRHINQIAFNDTNLRSGSRVDGVFLEVWRSEISPQTDTNEVQNVIKPQPVSKLSNLNGVWMFNETTGWAVGDNGTILKTIDGGNNWVTVNTPVNINFRKVQFSNLEIGYAIAEKGIIIKTLDGGNSWFTLETPVTDNLNDLYVLDGQNICIVGDNGTVLLAIDGTHFNLVSQTSGSTANLSGVTFFDVSVGWAVGDNGTLLMSKDGGHSWQKYTVTNSATGILVTESLLSVAFYNLNDGIIVGTSGAIFRTSDSGFTWANMSSRIWSGGAYKTIQEIFPGQAIDFKKVFIRNEFTIRFVIGVYADSRNFFKNLVYKISPTNYPNSLVLEFTGTNDNINYIKVLDLDQYATAEDLRDAINQQTSPYLASDASLAYAQRQQVRVFDASIEYEAFSKPSDFRPSAGSFSSLSPAQLSFSVEDRAWIAGNLGTVLVSRNSGSKWEVLDLGVGYDLNCVFFTSDVKGWFVGSDGAVLNYDSTITEIVTTQDTDLVTRIQGRIFPEGNVLSSAEDYLRDDIINPQVGVETTKRVQIQYRIRIIESVDPFGYPESGLGHDYLFSQGPNLNITDAGNYTFSNMGPENGDYGLWRSRCRGTYDGYTWAIPMFFVSRRNSGSFDIRNNINGSTYFELGAIRPDGLTYERIVADDITDIRRQVVIQSYSHLLQKNLDKLLSNNLKTNLSDRDQRGLQYGTSILMADQFSGETALANLVSGGVSSSAIIVEDSKTIDPNIQITVSELTFGPLDNGLYHNDDAYYIAYVVRDSVVTTEPVTGTFEGQGTNKVVFHIADNFTPAGGTLTGVQYKITTHYIDYSRVGLSRVPQQPISVKYVANPLDTTETYYFNGISAREDRRVLEYLTENIPGYTDYTYIYSAKPILDNVQDQALYALLGYTPDTDKDAQRSLRKYEGQQFRGSLVEYHYFTKVDVSTNVLRIPKNLNGYAIFGVRSVHNVNGSSYKISIDFTGDLSMRDREIVNNTLTKENLVVYLDEAFTIPANALLEVVLEACVDDSILGGPDIDTGITVIGKGETQEALRTSFTANYNVASRGLGGMYVGVLYPITITSTTSIVQIDLTGSNNSIDSLKDGSILGLISCETKEKTQQPYFWYQADSLPPQNKYFTMVPVQSVQGLSGSIGLGSSQINISIDPRKSLGAGTILVPLLVKLNTLPGLSDTSVANVFYKYTPYQTIGNLPSELTLEVLNMSDFVFVTNLGTGASELIKGEPYEVPAEHIAVNDDTIASDNFFSNVDDLDFANYSIDTGFVKLPGILSQYVGEDLTLTLPNNIGDKSGRTFYSTSSVDVIAQAENMILGTPRKVFVPMLCRVRSAITEPLMRGELVLVIFSKAYKARKENKTGFYEDENVEYKPGYVEYAETAVAVYRLTNKPLVRK